MIVLSNHFVHLEEYTYDKIFNDDAKVAQTTAAPLSTSAVTCWRRLFGILDSMWRSFFSMPAIVS